MNVKFAACALAVLTAPAAEAATTYNFVVAPVLGANGRPLADDGGRVDGRTFTFSIAADEVPTAKYSALFGYPDYFMKSYNYTEFGSTAVVTVPAASGRNVEFLDYASKGGLLLTNDGNRNFEVFGDTVGGNQSEVLYDDTAYKAAVAKNSSAQPAFKLGTFLLSTYPRNSAAVQPIQNYTVTISALAAAVPEVGTWAMMIAGVGLVGAAQRRRRPRTVAAVAA